MLKVMITICLALSAVVSSALAMPVRWAGNGHIYEAVLVPEGVTWADANAAAQARGRGWHLATVTSAEENAFVYSLVSDNPAFWRCCFSNNAAGPWLGGVLIGPKKTDYAWVTGEPFVYTNWGPSEPFGNGNRIALFGYQSTMGPTWNDYPASATTIFPNPSGYIVENEMLLDHFMCYQTKSTKGDLCTADAPVNAGGTCEIEEDCGGATGDEDTASDDADTDATSFCLPNKFPKGLRVALGDQFEGNARMFDVKKPVNLCLPADRNGEGIGDASTHLQGFQLALTKGKCAPSSPANSNSGCTKETDCGGSRTTDFCVKQAKSVKHANIGVINQFHSPEAPLQVDAIKPDRLLVPAAKGSLEPVPAPDAPPLDPYKCYKVRVSQGAPRFTAIPAVAVADEFTLGPRVFRLSKPTRLCTPTHEGGEDVKNPNTLLLCYQAKPVKGLCVPGAPTNAGGVCSKEHDCGGSGRTSFCLVQEKFQKVRGLFVNNEFGPEQVDATKETEFCVPSEIPQPD